MKIENITIKRRQIVLEDKEFRAINNACCYLKNACGLVATAWIQKTPFLLLRTF